MTEKMYSAADLQILEFDAAIQRRPATYFGVDRRSPDLATRVVCGVLAHALHPASRVAAAHTLQVKAEIIGDLAFVVSDDRADALDDPGSAVWDPKSPHRFIMNVRVDNGGDVPTHLSNYSVDRLSSMTIDRLWIPPFPIQSFDAVSASVVSTNYTLPGQASAFLIMFATLTCPPVKPAAHPKIRLNQDGNRIQVDLPGTDWLQDDADGVCVSGQLELPARTSPSPQRCGQREQTPGSARATGGATMRVCHAT